LRRPLLFLAAVLVLGVYFISLREGSRIYGILFTPSAFCALPEASSEKTEWQIEGRVLFSETGETEHSALIGIRGGKIKVSISSDLKCPLPGETVLLRGKASLYPAAVNPGMFDTGGYYDHMRIWYRMEVSSLEVKEHSRAPLEILVFRFRERGREVIRTCAREADRAVCLNLFCGDRSGLNVEEREAGDFGLSFLASFSGLHITLIVLTLYRLIRRFGDKWTAFFVSLAISAALWLLTGRSITVFRGALVAAVRCGAPLVKRKFDYISAVSLALLLMILSCPGIIFVSSFAYLLSALFSVGLFYPALREVFQEKKRVLQSMQFTLTLAVFLLPVRLFTSYEYVLLSLPVSMLSVLLFPCLMLFVWGGTLTGFLSGRIAKALFLPAHSVLSLLTELRTAEEKLSPVIVTGRAEAWKYIAYFAVLLLLLIALRLFLRRNRELPEELEMRPGRTAADFVPAVLAALLLFGLLFLRAGDPVPEGSLLLALDVGQGDCNVILTPGHEAALIDCGSAGVSEVYEKRVEPALKYYGVRRVSVLFLSHSDSDHVSGACELLEDYSVRYLIIPEYEGAGEDFGEIIEKAEECGTELLRWRTGDALTLRSGDRFSCLWPEKDSRSDSDNEISLVLLYEESGFRGLYTGDISSGTERQLRLPEGPVDYLKVAHHGSRYSSSPELLSAISPRVASVSCSRNNSYGHPSPEVINRLEACGTDIFITFRDGAILLLTREGCLDE